MTPSVSYLIFSHDEGSQYLDPLLRKLVSTAEAEDEIVLIDDGSTEATTLATIEKYKDNINLYHHALCGDFATHKNFGRSKCAKDVIFQIDADELPHDVLLGSIKKIFLKEPSLQMIRAPRINIVHGLTKEDVIKWNWTVDKRGWVNYPDYQDRIFVRNIENIRWQNKVHERLVGYVASDNLPATEEYSLFHAKDIARQRLQNDFYRALADNT